MLKWKMSSNWKNNCFEAWKNEWFNCRHQLLFLRYSVLLSEWANQFVFVCLFLSRWNFILLLSVCSAVLSAEEEYLAQGTEHWTKVHYFIFIRNTALRLFTDFFLCVYAVSHEEERCHFEYQHDCDVVKVMRVQSECPQNRSMLIFRTAAQP